MALVRPSWSSAQSEFIPSHSVSGAMYDIDSTVFIHRTFEPVHSLLVSSRVNKMKAGPHGVWVSFRSSTTISLYDSFVYLKLLEVDYTTLCTTLPGAVDAEVSYMYCE